VARDVCRSPFPLVTRRMAESAAYLVDEVIPRVPVRQWVLSFPIPLRILFAAPPELLTPVLLIIHRAIAGFLRKQAGLQGAAADTGAVTLIQRFGSAANLNIHLHCLLLAGESKSVSESVYFLQLLHRRWLRYTYTLECPNEPQQRFHCTSCAARRRCRMDVLAAAWRGPAHAGPCR